MIRFDDIPNIYLISGSTDLRKGIDGYASIIQDLYHLSPFSNALFLFCNKDHNKLKCLYWDGTGFWYYKNLHAFPKMSLWHKNDTAFVLAIYCS